jgi:Uma2 family endonuclease
LNLTPLVYRCAKILGSAVEVVDPLILFEVLSLPTRHIDASSKLAGYFRLPSVRHYLIVDPAQRLVIHHSRGDGDGDGDAIATRIIHAGRLRLDPPGIDVALDDVFAVLDG